MPTERPSRLRWWGGRSHVLFTIVVFVAVMLALPLFWPLIPGP